MATQVEERVTLIVVGDRRGRCQRYGRGEAVQRFLRVVQVAQDVASTSVGFGVVRGACDDIIEPGQCVVVAVIVCSRFARLQRASRKFGCRAMAWS